MLSQFTTKAGMLLDETPGIRALRPQACLAKVQKHHATQTVPIM